MKGQDESSAGTTSSTVSNVVCLVGESGYFELAQVSPTAGTVN